MQGIIQEAKVLKKNKINLIKKLKSKIMLFKIKR
jgi:hypothetical protein